MLNTKETLQSPSMCLVQMLSESGVSSGFLVDLVPSHSDVDELRPRSIRRHVGFYGVLEVLYCTCFGGGGSGLDRIRVASDLVEEIPEGGSAHSPVVEGTSG